MRWGKTGIWRKFVLLSCALAFVSVASASLFGWSFERLGAARTRSTPSELSELYRAHQYSELLTRCNELERQESSASFAQQVLYAKWAALRQLQRFKEAQIVAEAIIARFPNSPLTDDVYLSVSLDRLNYDRESAVRRFKQIEQLSPRSDTAKIARALRSHVEAKTR